jgi:hypothetical protein
VRRDDLIPVLLAVVSASPAMKLRDLTPGDIRLILTRREIRSSTHIVTARPTAKCLH